MPTLPTNPHYIGDSGHVNDHNTIVTALTGLFATPNITVYSTATTGTYTTPSGARMLRIRMVGGGGGGAGGGTGGSPGSGGAGGSTTFGSSLLTCTGGAGGSTAAASSISTGGTATINSPAISILALTGEGGRGGNHTGGATQYSAGEPGGASPFTGAGTGAANAVGSAGKYGSGGGGGGTNLAGAGSGGGGAAGGYIEAIIMAPSATYSYGVGAAGTAGTAGTNAFAGGTGGVGYIVVEAYF